MCESIRLLGADFSLAVLNGADLRNVELNSTALVNVDLSGANLVGIKYDNLILPMIASSKLDNAKMSSDMQKDIENASHLGPSASSTRPKNSSIRP